MYPGEKLYIPTGHPNRPGTKLTALKAIVVHYTGNDRPGADAKMNAGYFGRAFKYVKVGGKNQPYDAEGINPFGYGSAQVIADMNTVVETMPLDEVAWGCGDQRIKPFDGPNKGYQSAARLIFDCKQNYQTLSVEICNNDAIKNSDADWRGAVAKAADWIVAFLREKKLRIDLSQSLDPQNFGSLKQGEILVIRHYDVIGKICPKPFVDDPAAWKTFVDDLTARVNV